MSIALAARSRRRGRTLRRTAIVGAASAATVLLFAGPALAHITVNPSSAPAGSAAELTFRVPNEEAKAFTVKVDVQIPTDHPIAQLLVKPVTGWTATVKTITLAKPVTTDDGTFNQAVSEVIWSGGKIQPGQFQDFSISADPLPTGVGQMTFKAIQTYSNGDTVRWIDVSQPGQPAPDHPAPILMLTTTSKAPATASTSTSHTGTATAASGSSSDGLSRVLGVAALIVALLACLLALMGSRRRRNPTADLRLNGTKASEPSGNGVLAGPKAGAKAGAKATGTKASGQRPTSQRRG